MRALIGRKFWLVLSCFASFLPAHLQYKSFLEVTKSSRNGAKSCLALSFRVFQALFHQICLAGVKGVLACKNLPPTP
jgi:hypothetical protein